MGITIRGLEGTDIPALNQLWQQAATELGAQGWQSLVDPLGHYHHPQRCCLVLLANQQLVGCAALDALPDSGRRTCLLERLYLHPRWRGQDLGETLLGRLLHQARRLGFKHCCLAANSCQTPLIRLCLQDGFVLLNEPPVATPTSPEISWLWLDL